MSHFVGQMEPLAPRRIQIGTDGKEFGLKLAAIEPLKQIAELITKLNYRDMKLLAEAMKDINYSGDGYAEGILIWSERTIKGSTNV